MNKKIINKVQTRRVSANIGYVTSLDGLRAIAVLLVMILHAHFQLGKNGTLGVDMFFALSGFLITTLLLEEQRNKGFVSLKKFYIRRFFRLFPALYVMLMGVLVYTFLFTNGLLKTTILKEILSSSLYLYNLNSFWGWRDGLILGHTWSLAVEEQFYFIWPLCLVFFVRYFSIKKILVALSLVVFIIWYLKFSNVSPILAMTFQESIFIGCIFSLLRWLGAISFKISNTLVVVLFFSLLFVGVFPLSFYLKLYNNNFRFIGAIFTMIIVLGLLQNSTGFISKLLSFPPLVAIGKISYALYLWHVPVFRWFLWHSSLPPFIAFILKFIVTFILAGLSWFLIEKKMSSFGKKYASI